LEEDQRGASRIAAGNLKRIHSYAKRAATSDRSITTAIVFNVDCIAASAVHDDIPWLQRNPGVVVLPALSDFLPVDHDENVSSFRLDA
jgi:hypothetical protein